MLVKKCHDSGMPASSLLALIDDIASILDDVAVLTKVAAKKTSGVLGDDLALNAEQVSGVNAERELPVVWAVAKGSIVNKMILVPVALLLSYFLPALITPLLLIGGLYLCFEGAEKVIEKFFHAKPGPTAKEATMDLLRATTSPIEVEKQKIKGAIRTDFILSAEIIVITMGSVQNESLLRQSLVLSAIALLMTVGVYGLVAGIVKTDDFGLYLSQKPSAWMKKFGVFLVRSMPYLMKFLGIAGTVAMFLVGGGIITHAWPWLHHHSQDLLSSFAFVADLLVGFVSGLMVVMIIETFHKIKGKSQTSTP